MRDQPPPLQSHRSRLRWCIETILRPVGIGHGRRMDIGPAERMQRGRDWYDAMEIAADSKNRVGPKSKSEEGRDVPGHRTQT